MSVELTYLLWSALLAIVQLLIASAGTLGQIGLTSAVGNREDMPQSFPGWVGRARRAHANLIENLIIFAVLVIVAHLAERNNDMTALGSMVFFWARVGFAAAYILGITWIRSLLWFVGFVGTILIAVQLL
jgi:uncharacterized MAPEG superfamily protein